MKGNQVHISQYSLIGMSLVMERVVFLCKSLIQH